MYVERLGESGPTVVLVHGSVTPGWASWEAQRPLADLYQLVVPHRTGYPPNSFLERIVERPPMEAEPPVEALARTPFPKLVVSGGHSRAFDAVCDFLTHRLGATRAVIVGRGHSVPRAGEPFNERLRGFIDAA